LIVQYSIVVTWTKSSNCQSSGHVGLSNMSIFDDLLVYDHRSKVKDHMYIYYQKQEGGKYD